MNQNYHLPLLNEKETYCNPISYTNLSSIPANPDPYLLKFQGYYYCYSTGEKGVNVSRSKDLCSWEFLGLTACEPDRHDYWAPCVIYDNGTFYMYCSNTGIDTKDNHQEYLQLFTASSPEGPFTWQKTFFEKFSIDAHVVKDHDGTPYLFYSVNDYMGTDEYHSETVILADRLINFTELAGEEYPVVLPSLHEEIFEENRFGDNRDWYTVEGAFFMQHHGQCYLIYAANAYVRENYYLGYSHANDSGRISSLNWEKYPSDHTFLPLVCRNAKVEGTGHCSVMKGPNLVEDWIIYHGRDQEIPLNPDKEQRVMRIDPLFFSGTRLVTNAPSYLAQDAPELPLLSCLSNMESDGFVISKVDGITRKITRRILEHYIMECDISSRPSHMGARYGLLLSFTDEANYVELQINSGKRCISIIHVQNRFHRTIQQYRLPQGYRHDVSHNLKVQRNFQTFCIRLDDIIILQADINCPYGHAGFFSRYSEAEVHYFAITEHIELYNEQLFYLSSLFQTTGQLIFLDNKIFCPSKAVLIMEENQPTENCMKSLECSLCAPDSSLMVEIVDNRHIILCSLKLEKGTASFTDYMSSPRQCVTWKYEENRFTLYIKQKGRKTALYLDNQYLLGKNSVQSPQKLRITAFQIEIHSYEMTKFYKT